MTYCLPVTLFHGYPDQEKLRKLAIEVLKFMINVIILSIILVLLVLYGFHEFLDIDDQ